MPSSLRRLQPPSPRLLWLMTVILLSVKCGGAQIDEIGQDEMPAREITLIYIITFLITGTLVCMVATSPSSSNLSGYSGGSDSEGEELDQSYLMDQDELSKHKIDIISGSKAGSIWYVLDDTYILYKIDTNVDETEVFLECCHRRRGKCPFKAGVTIEEDGNIKLSYMYSLDRHHCDQDGVDVVVQKFKSAVKAKMTSSHKAKYGQVEL